MGKGGALVQTTATARALAGGDRMCRMTTDRPRLQRSHRSGESRHRRTKIPARKCARAIPTATPATAADQRRREPEPLRVRSWLVTERGVQDLHRMPTTKRPGGACPVSSIHPRHALHRRGATSSRCPHLPWWQVPSAGRVPLTDPLMKKNPPKTPAAGDCYGPPSTRRTVKLENPP